MLARQNFTGRHVWDNPGLSGYLVCLIHLVSLMQPNKPDRPNRPNEQDRLADCFSILRNLTDIDRSTAANDPRPSASFSAMKNPQRIPVNTPPVFLGLPPCIWPHLLRLVTKAMSDRLLENTKANRHPRWLVEATPVGLHCNQPLFRVAGRPTAPVYQKWASHLFRGISEQETSPYHETRPNQ